MACSLCKIEYNCSYCGKKHIKKLNRAEMKDSLSSIKEYLKNEKLQEWKKFCNNSCAKLYMTSPGHCLNCKEYKNKRMITGYCYKCSSQAVPGICTSCGEDSKIRNATGICSNCISNFLILRTKPGICRICKKHVEKRDVYGQCKSCNIAKAKEHSKPGFCKNCGNKVKLRNAAGLCNECSSNSGEGICTSCNKKSKIRNRYGLCPGCFKKDNSGGCLKCGKHSEKLSVTGLCKECQRNVTLKSNIINSSPGNCNMCGKDSQKRSITGLCKECNLKLLNNAFDREKFYNSKLSLISFKSSDNIISLDDIDSLNNIPGVWSIWSSDNKCLDVCQTINIGKEMLGWVRNYNACKNKTDDELIEMNKIYQSYNRVKKRDIADYCKNLNSKPIFKLVKININDKTERENIEVQYAHNNKSIFWNPAPNQKLSI